MKRFINRFCERQCIKYFLWLREHNGFKQAINYGSWLRRFWLSLCVKVERWTSH